MRIFPATPLRSDLLFEVMDEDGRLQILHYELQGRTSHKPMPYRELEYMSQVTIREIPLPLGPNTTRLILLIDTPYLRRMREKGREEGVQIGGPINANQFGLSFRLRPDNGWPGYSDLNTRLAASHHLSHRGGRGPDL
jgi:hypothetical protein